MTNEPEEDISLLPEGLPVPVDDGACDHLPGLALPSVALQSTDGGMVRLSELRGTVVLYLYPMTGPSSVPLPRGWDEIPGARGCTPQACSFRNHYAELQALDAMVYGMSTQSAVMQQTERARIHLPFALLSDEELAFATALRLPLHRIEGLTLHKRVTLVTRNAVIEKVFYPVFPPDRNADAVIEYLKH
jgi:peroxiredoxin